MHKVKKNSVSLYQVFLFLLNLPLSGPDIKKSTATMLKVFFK